MRLDRVRAVADAVLLEGYALYPYRASSRKNHFRWAFGVLAPRAWSEAGGSEAWWMESQCLLEPSAETTLDVKARFLQTRRRTIERSDDGGVTFVPVDSLEVEGQLRLSWDEGEVREVDCPSLHLDADLTRAEITRFEIPAFRDEEMLATSSGEIVGRVVRTCSKVSGTIRVSVESLLDNPRLAKVTVRVENETACPDVACTRTCVLALSAIATHVILAVRGGAFASLLDPPEWAQSQAAACKNVRTYPVLAGAEGERDLVLSAPIILYDHPRVAPESPGDLFDATEIDEILTLRTSALTDAEKREARATDARAAALLDRVERMPPELMARLHGAARQLSGSGEMTPEHAQVAPGARVRLAPSRRRADAQDFLFTGQMATVEAVLTDVDNRTLLAVTIDQDPAADLHRWYGRYLYYGLDEVEILSSSGGAR